MASIVEAVMLTQQVISNSQSAEQMNIPERDNVLSLLLTSCCVLRSSALFEKRSKPVAVNSSLTVEMHEFHMWIRVQLANAKGFPAWNRRAGGRGTAHEQVFLHRLSIAAVGRISPGSDIQHNHRP